MGLGGGAGVGLSLPGGYINGAPNPKDVKKLKSKLDGDGSEEYQPIDEKVVDGKVICDNCNWEWEMKDGGDDMYLCHKCGYDNEPKSPNQQKENTIVEYTGNGAFYNDGNTTSGTMWNANWDDYDSEGYYLDNLEGWVFFYEKPSEVEKKKAVDQKLPTDDQNDGKTHKYHRILKYNFPKPTDNLAEGIELDVKLGDTILMGKFKNHKVVVKSISKDEYGMPTINGKKVATFRIPKNNEVDEMAKADMDKVEKYADAQLSPEDVVLGKETDHFFQRLNDPRNGKEISPAELTGFFKRLGRNKKKLLDFVKQYKEFVVKDKRTNINIPFMVSANKLIAKTVMRKDDFKSSTPVLTTESKLIKENINESKLLMEGVDYVVCKVCGEKMKQIQYRHLMCKHNMSMVEYKSKYPTATLVCESAKNIGDKNPMKNDIVKENHKKSVNTLEYKNKISEQLIGKNVGNVRPDLVERNKSIENRIKVSKSLKETYKNNSTLRNSKSIIGTQFGFGNKELLETFYDKLGWTRPENRNEFALYQEIVRRKSNENYKLYFDEIPNAKNRSREYHLDHKYSIKEAFDNKIPIEVVSHYKNLQIINGRLNESKGTSSSILLEDLIRQMEYSIRPVNTKVLLQCGGAYGHMHHPFDIEMNLTFSDLKNIVKKALTGDLDVAREKTDGQALAISWVNGRLVAARNKSHLKNKGEGAMTMGQVADKFANRGGLTDAYNFAMKDLSSAISQLSDKQREKIFNGGSSFMNLEVIYPTSVNVIPYNQPLLVFHGTFDYDINGNIVGENQTSARILAGMIKQVNGHVQSKYTIQGPPMQRLPKTENLSKLQGKYFSMIGKLQSEFGLADSDGVADYHQKWWEKFVAKEAKGMDTQQQIGLVKRWAFGDKSFRLGDIKDEKLKAWADKIDKQDQAKIAKENLMKFEEIFLGVGADVLGFMESVLTANPTEATKQMVARLNKTIQDVKKLGDPKKLDKLKLELQRLQALGGFEKIVPNEGIVFVYNGNTYKLTGAFAPLNQILGLFYE
jgi:hypothetical protein